MISRWFYVWSSTLSGNAVTSRAGASAICNWNGKLENPKIKSLSYYKTEVWKFHDDIVNGFVNLSTTKVRRNILTKTVSLADKNDGEMCWQKWLSTILENKISKSTCCFLLGIYTLLPASIDSFERLEIQESCVPSIVTGENFRISRHFLVDKSRMNNENVIWSSQRSNTYEALKIVFFAKK